MTDDDPKFNLLTTGLSGDPLGKSSKSTAAEKLTVKFIHPPAKCTVFPGNLSHDYFDFTMHSET